MVSKFGFLRTPWIIFGWGEVEKIPGLLMNRGRNVLVLTGAKSYRQNQVISNLLSSLEKSGFSLDYASIETEPSPKDIDSITEKNRSGKIDGVIAIGGGSVIDAGKAVSAMLPLNEPVRDYLEGVGSKKHPGVKKFFVAVPTTSGTGSEATANAVISETGLNGFKRSLRHDNLVPDIALVDPRMTVGCPPEITAASGMDAFTQLVESYLSIKAGALTDALALEGIAQIHSNLYHAVKTPDDPEARSGMALAALISGITLSNAGLGLIHGFASSIGGMHKIPHGVVCGTLMGAVNRYNINALLMIKEISMAHEKYGKLGKLFSGTSDKKLSWYMHYAADYIEQLTDKLKIRRLGEYGITSDDVELIAHNTEHKANPVRFEPEQMVEMLKSRL